MYPRAKALGIVIFENKILLEEFKGKHSKGTGIYYRPLGGTIEYGEKSNETIIREYKEEIEVDVEIVSYMSCLENIFTIGLNIGHEIIQVYLVKFKIQLSTNRKALKSWRIVKLHTQNGYL